MRPQSILLGSIASFVLAPHCLAQDPIGGWFEAEWSAQLGSSREGIRFVDDLNGDGVPELSGASKTRYSPYWIDPITGEVLFAYRPRNTWNSNVTGLASDLDGDGVTEFVVADRDALVPGFGSGRIMVFRSGSEEGELLWSIDTDASRPIVGTQLALSDVDGDQLCDVIGTSSSDLIEAWSGVDQRLLWRYRSEDSLGHITPVVDQSGDAIQELLVTGGNKSWLLDGASGAPMWEANVGGSNSGAGHIEWVDLTLDGTPDLIAAFGILDRIFAVDGATGAVIWYYDWDIRYDEFGDNVQVVDLTGEGVSDVVIRESRATLSYPRRIAIDGQTGSILWDKSWSTWNDSERSCAHGDLNGDGIDDEVVLAVWGDYDGTVVEALDGRTAQSLWRLQAIFPHERLTQVQLIDVDGDSVLDVIVSGNNPEIGWNDGIVRALHGSTGSELWETPGPWDRARLGRRIQVAQRGGEDSILVCEAQSDDRCSVLVGLDIKSGVSLWTSEPLGLRQAVEAMDILDLDQDGDSEVLLQGAPHVTPRRGLYLLNATDGSVRWSSGVVETFLDDFGVLAIPDGNGDQVDEVLLAAVGQLAVCGATGGYDPGLEASIDTISASNPQDFALHVHFPKHALGNHYSLLWSENGLGATWGDTLIPFASGRRLEESDRGDYPAGLFFSPRGKVQAQHHAVLVAASQWLLPPSIWGRELGFAVQFDSTLASRPLVTRGVSVRIMP